MWIFRQDQGMLRPRWSFIKIFEQGHINNVFVIFNNVGS